MTFKQFVEDHKWPTLAALRCIYFDAKQNKNAFLPAFSKVGKRLLVDPIKFFKIVETDGNEHKEECGAVS